jgi:hypothetical protein
MSSFRFRSVVSCRVVSCRDFRLILPLCNNRDNIPKIILDNSFSLPIFDFQATSIIWCLQYNTTKHHSEERKKNELNNIAQLHNGIISFINTVLIICRLNSHRLLKKNCLRSQKSAAASVVGCVLVRGNSMTTLNKLNVVWS